MIAITILLSIITCASFIIGNLISKIIGYKKLIYFSISLMFITLLSSLIINIIPNIFKLSTKYNHLIVFIITVIISIILFIFINHIIPNNNYKYSTIKKEKDKYLNHISNIALISVILFNILCGIVLLIISKNDIKNGINYAKKLCLFNFPFGVALSTSLCKPKQIFSSKFLLLTFSSLVGVIIGYIVPNISNNVLLILFSFICGMLLSTSLLLYGVEVIKNNKKTGITEGLLIGLIIFAYILL